MSTPTRLSGSAVPPKNALRFESGEIVVTTPEGIEARMTLAEFFAEAAPRRIDTCDLVLPPGTIAARSLRGGVVLATQTAPRVWPLRWICNDSPDPAGPSATYRNIKLSLPYIVLIAVIRNDPGGGVRLTTWCEAYFANQPVTDAKDRGVLRYPALLNVAPVQPSEHKPLAWICTQHLDQRPMREEPTLDGQLRRGIQSLFAHLMEGGFNRHCEASGIVSHFTLTVQACIDPRIASVDTWEKATRAAPACGLDIPWMPVGRSLAELMARGANEIGSGEPLLPVTESDVARIVQRRRMPAPPKPPAARPAEHVDPSLETTTRRPRP